MAAKFREVKGRKLFGRYFIGVPDCVGALRLRVAGANH